MCYKSFVYLTIFPDQIKNNIDTSITLKAQKNNNINVSIINIRDRINHQVDDYAFGSGGMVLMAPPIINRLREHNLLNEHIILVSPRGSIFTQKKAQEISKINKKIVFICGHYEGVDERVCKYVTEEISIGNYLLSSGELAALVISDSIIRLIPGVINPDSLESESFNDDLLDYPAYTRPYDFEGDKVPDILLSGDHKKIREYRMSERIRITKKFRPDLYKKYLNKG